jgi:hypothetical protein
MACSVRTAKLRLKRTLISRYDRYVKLRRCSNFLEAGRSTLDALINVFVRSANLPARRLPTRVVDKIFNVVHDSITARVFIDIRLGIAEKTIVLYEVLHSRDQYGLSAGAGVLLK